MSEVIFLTSSAKQTKTKVTDITRKINDASSEITSAKRKLDNVEYVNVSYELDQLQTLYKNNNTQDSEFEEFAKQLENMVNDYEKVDNDCAKKIKSSGKEHRKSTGLHKNLALATISASFDKMGDTLDAVGESVEQWVDGVVDSIVDGVKGAIDWIINSIKEDWQSWLQLSSAVLILSIAGVFLATCSSPIAIGLAVLSVAMQLDKIYGVYLDISNKDETEGESYTQSKMPLWYDIGFSVIDGVITTIMGNALGKAIELINLSKVDDATQLVSNIDNINQLQILSTVENMQSTLNIAENIDDFSSYLKYAIDIKNLNISSIAESIRNDGITNILEEIMTNPKKYMDKLSELLKKQTKLKTI